jgi:hypothetical protein
MHAGRGRIPDISADEFVAAVDGVERTNLEGLCVFRFSDFLAMRDSDTGRRMIDRLRRFRRPLAAGNG